MSKYTARHMAIVVPCEHWLNEVSVDVVQGNAWNCFLGYCVLLCDLKGFFFFFFSAFLVFTRVDLMTELIPFIFI